LDIYAYASIFIFNNKLTLFAPSITNRSVFIVLPDNFRVKSDSLKGNNYRTIMKLKGEADNYFGLIPIRFIISYISPPHSTL